MLNKAEVDLKPAGRSRPETEGYDNHAAFGFRVSDFALEEGRKVYL